MRGQVQESGNPQTGGGACGILRVLHDASTSGRRQISNAISLSRTPQETEAAMTLAAGSAKRHVQLLQPELDV